MAGNDVLRVEAKRQWKRREKGKPEGRKKKGFPSCFKHMGLKRNPRNIFFVSVALCNNFTGVK